jgi:parallel beta-helix repeat protein
MKCEISASRGRLWIHLVYIVLFFLLAMCVLLILSSDNVIAETNADYSYQIINDGNAIEITEYFGASGNINIPNSIDGLPVISIDEQAFAGCTYLTSVTIPSSVISIGNGAFAGCTSLSSIDVDALNLYYSNQGGILYSKDLHTLIQYPAGIEEMYFAIASSVLYISEQAFAGCTYLTSVTIPYSVQFIGNGAFAYCSSLMFIGVDTSNSYYSSQNDVLYDKGIHTLIQYPVGTQDSGFVIPYGVQSIGNGAFAGCTYLTIVTIPSSVTSIGNSAFAGCTNLASITIPYSVQFIGNGAFAGCTSLSSIAVDSGNLYYACQNGILYSKDLHTLIQYPAGIEEGHFSVPSIVYSIGDSAFDGCANLFSIELTSSITCIGFSAFDRCTSLNYIYLSGNPIYEVYYNVLYDKAKTTLILCPEGMTRVTVPDTVQTINDRAFSNRSSLTEILFMGDSPFCGSHWLYNNDPDLKIYYLDGKTGFRTPTWYGVPTICLYAPSAPQNLLAEAGIDQITLNWDAPQSDGGADIQQYKIYKGISSGGETYLTTLGDLSYTDTSVNVGMKYYYKVRAVNIVGEGLSSETTIVLTIRINSNAEFAQWASEMSWPGDGSSATPYIIEGYTIDARGSDSCIFIGNTTVHFIIQYCILYNATPSGGAGIELYHMSNGVIDQCFIHNCDHFGIVLDTSSSNIITNNTCDFNGEGIYLYCSSFNILFNNTCNLNAYGISLTSISSNNTLINNICNSNAFGGICLYSFSSNNTLMNNTCNSSDYGIIISSSAFNTLINNTCTLNYDGIYLSSSSYNVLSNIICNSNYYGIVLYSSSYNILTNNAINSNTLYGINLVGSGVSNNILSRNILINNNGASSVYHPDHIQACDIGVNNHWNSTTYGNYWADWTYPDEDGDGIADVPYLIAGSAYARDLLPIVGPMVNITFPTSEATYNSKVPDVNLAGIVSDPFRITSITWTNDRGGAGSGAYDSDLNTWAIDGVPLLEGVNVITVIALDSIGRSGFDIISITRSPIVEIPDANLEVVIRAYLNKPTGYLYPENMEQIMVIIARNQNIIDLTGLEYCTNLQYLDMEYNDIFDMSPLSGLISLTYLDLSVNAISDLTPLSGLTGLTELYLTINQISDIAPLQSLTGLKSLSLFYNNIVDLGPLSLLVGLESLDLASNPVSNIQPLSALTSLTTLYLYDNSVSDISALEGLTGLTTLMLGMNDLSDISPLRHLTALTFLTLFDNSIEDITPLSYLTNLEYLTIGRNHIVDITPLSGLALLKSLRLYENEISDISPLLSNSGLGVGDMVDITLNHLSPTSYFTYIPILEGRGVEVICDEVIVEFPDAGLEAAIRTAIAKPSGPIYSSDLDTLTTLIKQSSGISDLTGLEFCTSLVELDLRANAISDLTPVSGLTNLERLLLGYNDNIANLEPLSGLTKLAELGLVQNQIEDLTPIAGLTSLTILRLSNNMISDLTPISGLVSLEQILLAGNLITDVSPLSTLVNLAYLSLSNNQITDIAAIMGLPSLIDLNIQLNYLNLLSSSDDFANINNLLMRGVNVIYTPQYPQTNIVGACPIDLVIIDPDGLVIDMTSCNIPFACYSEMDVDSDGDTDDDVFIPCPKPGTYQITVIWEPGAQPTDLFSLYIVMDDDTIVTMAQDVELCSIPSHPYLVEWQEEGTPIVHSAACSITPTSTSIEPGGTASYAVTIINTGTDSEYYALTLNTISGSDSRIPIEWFLLSADNVNLDSGQSTSITVTVSVPAEWASVEDVITQVQLCVKDEGQSITYDSESIELLVQATGISAIYAIADLTTNIIIEIEQIRANPTPEGIDLIREDLMELISMIQYSMDNGLLSEEDVSGLLASANAALSSVDRSDVALDEAKMKLVGNALETAQNQLNALLNKLEGMES